MKGFFNRRCTQMDADSFRVFCVFRGYISTVLIPAKRALTAPSFAEGEGRRFLSDGRWMPNQVAALNRRLRLGLVPWSFGTLISQGSAVGELGRSTYA